MNLSRDPVIRLIRRNKRREKLPDPAKYNASIREGWMTFWAKNVAKNHAPIEEIFKRYNADFSAVPIVKDRDCVIIGSGPSLDKALPYLKDFDGDIFCSSSHLQVLEAEGIKPTYCVIIDADPTQTFLIETADTSETMLVTHPCMETTILEKWKGPVYFFRMHDPGDEFFAQYVPMMYGRMNAKGEGVKFYVMNAGCVVNTCVGLAQAKGYRNIFLCGVDFGYPGDQYRFRNYQKKDGGWVREDPIPPPPERKGYEGTGGVWADSVSCFYKYSFLVIYGMDRPNLISCSDGIIAEIPRFDPAILADPQGIPQVDRYLKYKRAQEYLRHRGVYIFNASARFRTFKNTFARFRKQRKRAAKFLAFTLRMRRQPVYPAVRHMMQSNRVKLTFGILVIEIFHTEIRVGFQGLMKIANRYGVGRVARQWLRIYFTVGRWLRIW